MNKLHWKWWLLWILVVVAGFTVIETIALVNSAPGDTLSERVWQLLDLTYFRIPFFICFVGGAVWLGIHFFTRGKL